MQLTPEEAGRLARTETTNSAAGEEFGSGRRYEVQGSDEALKKAIEHYSQAVQLQPDYALAYAGLAQAWAELRATDHSAAEANAEKAAAKALELGPDLAETHVAMATIEVEKWHWRAGADEQYQAALRLDPNSVESCACYAYFLVLMRRFPEALLFSKAEITSNPLSPESSRYTEWPWLHRANLARQSRVCNGRLS